MADIFTKPTGRCVKCNTREAALWFSTDVMSGARGYASPYCEICSLYEQIAHAKERAAELPKLEARLAELLATEHP